MDPHGRQRAALRWARDPDGHPCDGWWSERAAAELRQLADDFEPDVVVVEQLWVHRYGEALQTSDRQLVLNAHNDETALHQGLARRSDGKVPGGLARVIAERVARRELAAGARADQIWAPSEQDRAALVSRLPAGVVKSHVVPSGIEVDRYAALPGPRERVLIYPASFGYPPNRRAAVRLVCGVLPLVRSTAPDALLMLVGADVPPELASAAGVRAPGRVPDVLPYLHGASVMPVALTDGSGTRLKVLEALAAGVAVVSTSKGVEGLDLQDGEHFLLAETDSELAAGVLRLWDDNGLREHLVASGGKCVSERYGPDAVAEAVAAALRESLL